MNAAAVGGPPTPPGRPPPAPGVAEQPPVPRDGGFSPRRQPPSRGIGDRRSPANRSTEVTTRFSGHPTLIPMPGHRVRIVLVYRVETTKPIRRQDAAGWVVNCSHILPTPCPMIAGYQQNVPSYE